MRDSDAADFCDPFEEAHFLTYAPESLSHVERYRHHAARLPNLKQRQAPEWRGPCPIHDGKDDNFAVEAQPDGSVIPLVGEAGRFLNSKRH
jgi:hypothetical protein